MPFKESNLSKADVMLVSSVVLDANRPSFDKQIEHLLQRLRSCLDVSLNSKVLMPVQPQFILEIVDILLH